MINNEPFFELKKQYPNIAGFATDDNKTKLVAGWLIEQCGWKGYREGDAGCYDKQALVLVNYGSAKGSQIYSLSQKNYRQRISQIRRYAGARSEHYYLKTNACNRKKH